MLLTAGLTLVRTAPFDAARTKAFAWIADQCFDSRMRIEIATAADRLGTLASGDQRDWATMKRSVVDP